MLNFGLNVLLVILFSVHVFFAFKGFRDSKVQLMHLLRQGIVELPKMLETSNTGDGGTGNSDDADYLNKIIKGEVDFTKANEIETQLEEIGNRLPADLSDLFEQAVSSYSVYQVGQASQIH